MAKFIERLPIARRGDVGGNPIPRAEAEEDGEEKCSDLDGSDGSDIDEQSDEGDEAL